MTKFTRDKCYKKRDKMWIHMTLSARFPSRERDWKSKRRRENSFELVPLLQNRTALNKTCNVLLSQWF